jgi:transketolase
LFAKYSEAHPAKAAELKRRFAHELPEGILDKLPSFTFGKDKDLATRQFSEACINAVAPDLEELVGGSADSTHSNLTYIKSSATFKRILLMDVISALVSANMLWLLCVTVCLPMVASVRSVLPSWSSLGIVLEQFVFPLSQFGVIYVMTHDSIGLGEDGPTHQPVETLESLRCIPNINVCRPADSMK